MLRKSLAGIGLALFVFGAIPAHAQEIATLALRNGERPSGELIDMNASGFALQINGQVRHISAGEVAAVEFVVGPLPAAAQARINAGQPVVLLRNGQVIEGRLSDIGGTHPLRLTVDTPSGPRDFSSNDVAQAHLNPLNGAAAPAGGAGAAGGRGTGGGGRRGGTASTEPDVPAGAIAVAANQPWTDTGMTVARGSRVAFTARGDIMTAAGASSGPGGSPAATVRGIRYPVPDAPVGALIGRIGTGAAFLIGTNSQAIQMPANGRLMLGVNDDQFGDNSGQYVVTVTRSGR